ncbi:MAG: TetR/AcrR family transcriptional regulator [Spirochaetaceae bacterium]|jgi:AcrR family transcriptional regulator|nr:TetR/AcrR family transcriptional regulator [Spirochaetaceae bacterium]
MNRRDRQKAQTLTDIMRSAEELFLEWGYEKTSMRQIAEHAGVTKGALYHHFMSKEELFENMCALHYSVLLEAAGPYAADSSLSCLERIQKIIALSRGMGISHITFVSEYLRLRNDEGSVILKERLRKYDKKFNLKVLAPLLGEAREKGECSFSVSPDYIALFMHQLDQGVREELNGIFLDENIKSAEKKISGMLDAHVYALSRLLGKTETDIAEVIGRTESLRFYHDLLRASQMG